LLAKPSLCTDEQVNVTDQREILTAAENHELAGPINADADEQKQPEEEHSELLCSGLLAAMISEMELWHSRNWHHCTQMHFSICNLYRASLSWSNY
jgi:hypothetical protein